MTGLILLAVYIAIFAASMVIVAWATKQFFTRADFTSLKTVTFGDESAVKANRAASVISVLAIFALWVAFTNSSLPLFKAKGPFEVWWNSPIPLPCLMDAAMTQPFPFWSTLKMFN